MRAREFLSELTVINKNLHDELINSENYEYLGGGINAKAYLDKRTGYVMKLIGYTPGFEGMDPEHKSFIVFADYCAGHPNDPYLPNFSDIKKIKYEGKEYLQVTCERLFPIAYSLAVALSKLAQRIIYLNEKLGYTGNELHAGIEKYINNSADIKYIIPDIGEALSLLDFDEFAKTIINLTALADVYGYGMDLHSANFMHGSDGSIVVNDPWVTA